MFYSFIDTIIVFNIRAKRRRAFSQNTNLLTSKHNESSSVYLTIVWLLNITDIIKHYTAA